MTATTRRPRRASAPFRVVELHQRWRIIEGRFYRDAVVELPDGSVHLYSLPEVAA